MSPDTLGFISFVQFPKKLKNHQISTPLTFMKAQLKKKKKFPIYEFDKRCSIAVLSSEYYFQARSSASITHSVRPSVRWMDGWYVPTMKFCEICLHQKLVTSKLLRVWGLVSTLFDYKHEIRNVLIQK
jgi:hypothetical protein